MATQTDFLNLTKPEVDDIYDIDVFYNPNMEAIDSAMELLDKALANLDKLTVKKKDETDIILTNQKKTATITIDGKGFSYYEGDTPSEDKLIFRIDNSRINVQKSLVLNGKNLETEIGNRYTKAEVKAEIEAVKVLLEKNQNDANKVLTDAIKNISNTLGEDVKDIKNKVQSKKLTPDTFDVETAGVYDINTPTLLEWIKNTEIGTKFIRKQENPIDTPTGNWALGILNKVSTKNATVILWSIQNVNTGKMYWQTIDLSKATSDMVKTNWNIVATQKDLEEKANISQAQIGKISADNGGPLHIFSDTSLLNTVIDEATQNKQMQTFYANSTVTDVPYPKEHYFGYYSRYNYAINIFCTTWNGLTFVNSYNTQKKTWCGWKELCNKQQLDLKADINKVQMKKITQDTGNSWYTTEGKTITEYLLNRGMGITYLYVRANTIDAPTTAAGTGMFHVHSLTGNTMYGFAYYVVGGKIFYQQIIGEVKKENWVCLASEKGISSLAQMKKITKDAGGTLYNLGKNDTFNNFFKNVDTGLATVYFESGISDSPHAASGRIIFQKTGATTEANIHGVGWGILFAGDVVKTIQWWGSGINSVTPSNWKKVAREKIINGTSIPQNSWGEDGDIYIQYI